MKALTLLSLLGCLITANEAKIFSRCELAYMLHEEGLDGYEGYSLANWICLAFFESGFNSAAEDDNADGSTDYGIFQINSRVWCNNYRSPTENLCHIPCTDLLSNDITDDIVCAKRIVQDPQGMDAWEDWTMHCKGRDLSEWVDGCDL
ncbi:lysozyme-like protein 1 [Terrapene carolina triunguis]|nr:lysozyme-like protein 1 [Terrapene carolina triunguis]